MVKSFIAALALVALLTSSAMAGDFPTNADESDVTMRNSIVEIYTLVSETVAVNTVGDFPADELDND